MNGNKTKKLGSNFEKEYWILRYSIFVGRIAEVPVYINFSFAFVFILITLSLSITILPNFNPGLVQSNYVIAGIICAFISLFSILFHEVAHSIIAKKYGIKFQKIILFAFGGIALQPIELIDPKKEMYMAFAGPLISFIISGLSFLIWFELHQSNMLIIHGFPLSSIVFYSAMINLVIGLFNLLPVFPSDGGRILRSFLSYRNHDQFKATINAIKIGWILSFSILIIGAAVGLKLSPIGGVWLMLVALFLMRASKSYYNVYQTMRPSN